jgi:multidrug resistance efflux pump
MPNDIAKEPGSAKEDSSPNPSPGSNADPAFLQEPKIAVGLDAVRLRERLAERVQAWERPQPVPEPEVVKISPRKPAKSGATFRRVAKAALALAVALALGWTPLQRLLQTTSSEAAVNARLITLRAPIDGEISLQSQLVDAGAAVLAGDEILRIVNRRADRSRVDDLRRTIAGFESERAALEQRKQQLEGLLGGLRKQRDAFQQGRVKQLTARIEELTSEIAAAQAQASEAASTLDRTQKLKNTGYQSQAALLRADRDQKMTANTAEALRHRLNGATVELDAARAGLFVGDSYNDIPRTAQRVDEITQQVIDVAGQLSERNSRISQLQSELSDEEKRFADLSSASVVAPVPGRVWEVLTANGEEVKSGQDLVRVLDCGGVVVTAAVSEAVYNDLQLGQAATFHLRGESEERPGHIVGLNGLAAVPANLAIEQKSLAREPYHVTVQVHSLGARSDCFVGRTGKVTFDTSTSVAKTRSAAANP